MRKQYHSRRIGQDRHIWDIDRLVRLSSDLPRIDVPLSEIAEIDENWWYADEGALPTPRSIAAHKALVDQTDLGQPIVLFAEGRLKDGMHRVVKAIT